MERLDVTSFAARLRALRIRYGWSQVYLARKAGVNAANLNEIEHARKPGLSAATVVALAKALGVTSDYLLGLSEKER